MIGPTETLEEPNKRPHVFCLTRDRCNVDARREGRTADSFAAAQKPASGSRDGISVPPR